MTPEVEQAVREIEEAFSGQNLDLEPDKDGGAYVIVNDVALGERFKPSKTWFGFYITFQYPNGDIYPHFMDASVRKADGREIPRDAVSGPTVWRMRQALQLSRKSNRWNPAVDTALLKLLKIIEWIKTK